MQFKEFFKLEKLTIMSQTDPVILVLRKMYSDKKKDKLTI